MNKKWMASLCGGTPLCKRKEWTNSQLCGWISKQCCKFQKQETKRYISHHFMLLCWMSTNIRSDCQRWDSGVSNWTVEGLWGERKCSLYRCGVGPKIVCVCEHWWKCMLKKGKLHCTHIIPQLKFWKKEIEPKQTAQQRGPQPQQLSEMSAPRLELRRWG